MATVNTRHNIHVSISTLKELFFYWCRTIPTPTSIMQRRWYDFCGMSIEAAMTDNDNSTCEVDSKNSTSRRLKMRINRPRWFCAQKNNRNAIAIPCLILYPVDKQPHLLVLPQAMVVGYTNV